MAGIHDSPKLSVPPRPVVTAKRGHATANGRPPAAPSGSAPTSVTRSRSADTSAAFLVRWSLKEFVGEFAQGMPGLGQSGAAGVSDGVAADAPARFQLVLAD